MLAAGAADDLTRKEHFRRRSGQARARICDEFDFETIGAGQVGGVVVRTAGVGMGLGEQQCPAAGRGLRRESIDAGAVTGVKREMVQPRPEPVVAGRGEGRRLLDVMQTSVVHAVGPPASIGCYLSGPACPALATG